MKKLLVFFLITTVSLLLFAACTECETCAFGDWNTVKEPTCTSEGEKVRTCTVCEKEERQTIEKTEHQVSFKETKTAASCTEDGVDIWACADCDHTEERTTDATGHSFGEWKETVAATCTTNGTQERTCSVCGKTKTSTTVARGHDYKTTTVKKATCSSEGLKKLSCTVCGDEREETISKTSHSFSYATCLKPATCKDCGTTTGSVSSHSYSTATCTTPGTCSVCGKTNGEALGHDYDSGKCKNCGETVSANIQLPTVPQTITYYSYDNKIYYSCNITSITVEKGDYYSYRNEICYKVYLTGESTYNYQGNNQSSAMRIGYKLYDSDGIVVDSGTAYTESVAVGEKFKEYITFYLTPGETYKLVLSNVN